MAFDRRNLFFYSEAPFVQGEKYLLDFLSLARWKIEAENTASLSALRLSLAEVNGLAVAVEGAMVARFREQFLQYLHSHPSLSHYKMGYSSLDESYVMEYQQSRLTYEPDESLEPEEAIEKHLQQRGLGDETAFSVKKEIFVRHQYKTVDSPNWIGLLKWLRSKTQSKNSVLLEGWGFFDKNAPVLTSQFAPQFEPDWKAMGRWLKNLVPAISVSVEELQKEFAQWKIAMQTNPSCDLCLEDQTVIWSGSTPEMLRVDHVTLQTSLVPSVQFIKIHSPLV